MYIYGVHCGKGSTSKFTSIQSKVEKHAISSIYWAGISPCVYMLLTFLCPGMFSKIKTFPQCTPYMYYWYISRAQHCCKQLYIYVYYSQTSAERSKVYKLSQTFKKKMYEWRHTSIFSFLANSSNMSSYLYNFQHFVGLICISLLAHFQTLMIN